MSLINYYTLDLAIMCRLGYKISVNLKPILIFEFSLNVQKFSDKNIRHYSKRAQTCHSATSCVRDQHATTAPARHM